VRIALIKELSLEVLPMLVMIVATHLYVRIDVIMLGHFSDESVVATYSAGYLFLDQLMILSNFMMSALFPNFARTTVQGGREFHALYRGILKLFAKYLVPLAVLIALFSKYLLASIYGAEYATAWPSLSILMVAALFAWLNGPSGTIFISLKKQHIYMWATLCSFAVNILGNIVLIPMVGAVGAAISTVLTEVTICSFCLYWIYRETGYLPWMRPNRVVKNDFLLRISIV
jgi:O-antigen/teichoic acid export membrane protein